MDRRGAEPGKRRLVAGARVPLVSGKGVRRKMRCQRSIMRSRVTLAMIDAAAIDNETVSPFTSIVVGWVSTKSQLPSTRT